MTTQLYRFKDIVTIPGVKELIDIVLSKTQRKTPTEVHKQFKISRIRSFYMRKIKFCEQTFNEKLSQIINQFPRLDEIHPFYSDLCNVLYDRDHYKLALGQCNSIRGIIDNIAKDYIRLIKYADSLYKCKMLKKAALGRMCTSLTKLKTCLPYLEEVRQHLARLPSINPNTRTLILTGYPNVGKSSFMNLVSNANVEVQPYAFTTKSLYVGHFDYAYTRWQIIDTPGILDHPLEERNTIEMTAITALAHIQASVIYIFDLSEQCGYTIEAQAQLFNSIKPLFHNKPLIILINKVDVRSLDDLKPNEKAIFDNFCQGPEFHAFFTSTLTGQGIDEAKNKACDILLEQKMNELSDKKSFQKLFDKIHITEHPILASRPPSIPEAILQKRSISIAKNSLDSKSTLKLEKDIENEMGGPGVYSYDMRKNYSLDSSEWKYDILPEIFDGKNVIDFIDPEIERKLEMLEQEEEFLLANYDHDQIFHENYQSLQNSLRSIHLKTRQIINENKLRKSRQGLTLPQKVLNKRNKFKILTTKLKSLENIQARVDDESSTNLVSSHDQSTAQLKKTIKKISKTSQIKNRNKNQTDILKSKQVKRSEKITRLSQKFRNRQGRQGDGDHSIPDFKPKHLFSGKMGMGKSRSR